MSTQQNANACRRYIANIRSERITQVCVGCAMLCSKSFHNFFHPRIFENERVLYNIDFHHTSYPTENEYTAVALLEDEHKSFVFKTHTHTHTELLARFQQRVVYIKRSSRRIGHERNGRGGQQRMQLVGIARPRSWNNGTQRPHNPKRRPQGGIDKIAMVTTPGVQRLSTPDPTPIVFIGGDAHGGDQLRDSIQTTVSHPECGIVQD
mmetsp:Transcript_18244/g.18491  ORF Transcript_18244/g.18491 Transcript_18244/m.18491 type:complete len:207 (+) Transcript_18244:337-957(+)